MSSVRFRRAEPGFPVAYYCLFPVIAIVVVVAAAVAVVVVLVVHVVNFQITHKPFLLIFICVLILYFCYLFFVLFFFIFLVRSCCALASEIIAEIFVQL